MKRLCIVLITLLILMGCDYLVEDAPLERENTQDPYWDPYSVLDQVLSEEDSLFYGSTVARSEDYIVVGAPATTVNNGTEYLEAGVAYVYHLEGGTWLKTATLRAPDGDLSQDMFFGNSVAIDGTTIAVGAPNEDLGYFYEGAVYLFTKGDGTTWNLSDKINSPSPSADNERFGYRVVLDIPYLIVSANQKDSVYLFKYIVDGYELQQTLTGGENFGQFLGYSDPWLLVGSHRDSQALSRQGSATLFERNGDSFTSVDVFYSPTPEANGSFGFTLSMDQNRAAIASLETVDNNTMAGRVYLYENDPSSGWSTTPTDIFESDTPASPGGYGVGISVLNDVLFIAAPFEGASLSGSGSIFQFNQTDWEFSHGYEEADTIRYGWYAFMDEDLLLVADNADEGAGGKVYIYSSNQ